MERTDAASRIRVGLLVAATLLAAALPATAVGQRDEAPIELEADRVDVDAVAGVSVYEGDAVLTRGEMRITGDRMEVYTDEDGDLSHVYVDGTPATYRDHPENQPRPVHAEAKRMEYYSRGPERAHFQGDAHLWQGDDQVTAETIDVDLEGQVMKARGAEGQRARTILYPARREEE
ncbi:MAG: lipopolysaccharide transport periplasmic protein LptA [Halorhodospira halophila]|uniref:lipopolysaccharide transport periplasmic protein LptA n=1 Tax=Halorhodospira TaxID=85108 RepID=UPI001EE8D910|nr:MULTISPECIES: lipopolysaccharide transport periplasmic protein LptA [Halorhodospira]MCC3750565.1 lipopolysaccharide transport periplasmic protein LptA [Halorhodospira halophila]MCG5538520.1 lipopolysaccharide transport periplasmic protein LptA [Halorhodospira sp. 9622]MCG5541085.1 lipopolysaccharide transport periplasmic protein LptA [Halorhodospira sp. M39old]MCG5546164.1 lipopolysaccharide transport periplasmic protein LptA [Halorhodospira sp. M38]